MVIGGLQCTWGEQGRNGASGGTPTDDVVACGSADRALQPGLAALSGRELQPGDDSVGPVLTDGLGTTPHPGARASDLQQVQAQGRPVYWPM